MTTKIIYFVLGLVLATSVSVLAGSDQICIGGFCLVGGAPRTVNSDDLLTIQQADARYARLGTATPTPSPTPTVTPTPSPTSTPTPSSDTTAPTVAITSPANGATLSGTVVVTTATSDNVGVTDSYLLVDDAVADAVYSSPFNFKLNTKQLTNGSHTMYVRAWDAARNSKDSTKINFTVAN